MAPSTYDDLLAIYGGNTAVGDLLTIYDELPFKDVAARDFDDGAVWFNFEEFARYRDVDGVKVLSIFCRDMRAKVVDQRANSSERTEGVFRSGGVLFLRADEVDGVYKANSPLRLDGRLYTIEEATLLQGYVWRIVLEANES